MKIIKTSDYMEKESQWNRLPGDPNLPPGVTNRMIDDQFGPAEREDIEKTKMKWEINRENQTIPIIVIYDVEWWEGNPVPYIYNALDINGDEIEITTEEGNEIEEAIRDKYSTNY